MATFTQEQLEEMVVGKKLNPNAIFFEHALLNVERSKAAGRRVYDTKIFIKLSQPGMTDTISYEAQKADIEGYPDEYQYFLQNKQGTRAPGIEIIPNLDIAHLQELRDYGILTIPQLAEAVTLPQHLTYAHRAAQIFNKALQETANGRQEESISEESTENVPTTDRQDNRIDVGRHALPASDRREEVHTANGHETGGQAQRHNGVKPGISDNWSLEYRVR